MKRRLRETKDKKRKVDDDDNDDIKKVSK